MHRPASTGPVPARHVLACRGCESPSIAPSICRMHAGNTGCVPFHTQSDKPELFIYV